MDGTHFFNFDAVADAVVAKINARREQEALEAEYEAGMQPNEATTLYSEFITLNTLRQIDGKPPLSIDEFNARKQAAMQ